MSTTENAPGASVQPVVRSGTPIETQRALVDVWLAFDRGHENCARLVLHAFKLGVEEGKRVALTGEPDTTLGVIAAFKAIMDALPDAPNAKLRDAGESGVEQY
jgi:hypothetical protein